MKYVSSCWLLPELEPEPKPYRTQLWLSYGQIACQMEAAFLYAFAFAFAFAFVVWPHTHSHTPSVYGSGGNCENEVYYGGQLLCQQFKCIFIEIHIAAAQPVRELNAHLN